jgi:hypothetical protein
MANNHPLVPPLILIKGRQEFAEYKEQEIPEFQGNPVIEALPKIWSREEVEERLSYYPRFSEKIRDLPPHLRQQLAENAREFFIPQGIHFEIETSISIMLRRGLIRRNPSDWSYWTELNERINELSSNLEKGMFLQTKARGFSIVGIGGMGKSSAVENVLFQYPQVIVHTKYHGVDLILKHLVWLKLDCPHDGSTRGLCINFFRAVDQILSTNYEKNYVKDRSTVTTLLPQMARVAALHCLGLLVIDEIQNISEAASGGDSQMINFFVQLENIIGVPFILIGTEDVMHLFCGKFHHARRLSEQGDVLWGPMNEKIHKTKKEIEVEMQADGGQDVEEYKSDPVWEEFIRALWDYQYVLKPTLLRDNLLEDKLSQTLYRESYGITAVAATLFVLAQRRAITTGIEEITIKIIESVSKDSQRLIQEYEEQFRLKGRHRALVYTPRVTAERSTMPENSSRQRGKSLKGRKSSPLVYEKEDLRNLIEMIKGGTPAYELLKQVGYRRASTEYLEGDEMQ